MAKVRPKELREMSLDNLGSRLKELKKELAKVNAKLSSGTNPENPGQIKQIRKAIARMLTIISEKKRQPQKKAEPKKKEQKKESKQEKPAAKEEKSGKQDKPKEGDQKQ